MQFEEASDESVCEEDEKMEVDGELNSKRNLDRRKREIVKQFRKIDEFTDLPREFVVKRKEKSRRELQDLEQRRND